MLFESIKAALSNGWGLQSTALDPNSSGAAAFSQIKTQIKAGNPVLALIHGYDLGRGASKPIQKHYYGDHWVVVTGYSDKSQLVFFDDPDQRPHAGYTALGNTWLPGGQNVQVSYETFTAALQDAHDAPGQERNYAIYVTNGVIPGVTPSPTPTLVPTVSPSAHPGGVWNSPANGAVEGEVVTFSAEAYPSQPGDPDISYVNFTVEVNGSWQVACTASQPKGDVYTCSADLNELRVPPGPVTISFDVYDSGHNHTLSPNGERTIVYQVTPACNALTSGPLAPGCAPPTIHADKSQYVYGETPTICYTVPGPYHVTITIIKPDGSSVTPVDGQDDGSGGCFRGDPTGPPAGQRSVRLDMSVNGSPLASVSTTYLVVDPCSVTASVIAGTGGQCHASITTDKSQYTMGESVKVCYQVPGPYHVTITLTKPDGTVTTILDADDDGTGGCLAPGPTGTPSGTRQLHMIVSSNGTTIATADTSYTVIADTDESLHIDPTSGPAGSSVAVSWTDDGDAGSGSGEVQFDGQAIASFNTNDGAWSGQVTIPGNAAPGDHQISIADDDGSSQSATFTVTNGGGGCSTTTVMACTGAATIYTSQSSYSYGEQLTVCYTVPGASHVTITLTKPDGTSSVILDGDDDGTGGCFSPGPIGPPPGTRHLHLDVSSGGAIIATADTSYVVTGQFAREARRRAAQRALHSRV